MSAEATAAACARSYQHISQHPASGSSQLHSKRLRPYVDSVLTKILAFRIYCKYNNSMQIEFDTNKRDRTLAERGLDFARVAEVFAGCNLTRRDDRVDYGEERFVTAGWLDG